MSYKERNRKLISLPSGATVIIRKLLARDYIGCREIPIMDLVGKRKSQKEDRELTQEQLQTSIALAKISLTNCTGQFCFGGETYKIVDKPSVDCSDSELSIDDLDQADADCIVNEVNLFSGWTPQAAEAARPFPEESPNGNPSAPAGKTLPGATNGDLAVAHG